MFVVAEAAYREEVSHGGVTVLLHAPWAWCTRFLSCWVKCWACAGFRSDVYKQLLRKTLTTAFDVLGAEDMTAAADEQLRDKPVLGIDSVRKALNCFAVSLVGISKRSAAYRASEDKVAQVAARWLRCSRRL